MIRVAMIALLALNNPLGAQEAVQRIRVVADPGLEGAAARVRVAAERHLPDVAERLGIPYSHELEIRVVRSVERMNDIIEARGGNPRPDHVVAVAFSYSDLIVLQTNAWASGRTDFEGTLRHELAHVVIGAQERRVERRFVPLWLNEGLAQWVADRLYMGEPELLLRAHARDRLLAFADIAESFPDDADGAALAYAQSLSFVRFLARGHGDPSVEAREQVPVLLRTMARGESFEEALETVTGMDLETFIRMWRGELKDDFTIAMKDFQAFFATVMLLVIVILAWVTRHNRKKRALEAMGPPEAGQGVDETEDAFPSE